MSDSPNDETIIVLAGDVSATLTGRECRGLSRLPELMEVRYGTRAWVWLGAPETSTLDAPQLSGWKQVVLTAQWQAGLRDCVATFSGKRITVFFDAPTVFTNGQWWAVASGQRAGSFFHFALPELIWASIPSQHAGEVDIVFARDLSQWYESQALPLDPFDEEAAAAWTGDVRRRRDETLDVVPARTRYKFGGIAPLRESPSPHRGGLCAASADLRRVYVLQQDSRESNAVRRVEWGEALAALLEVAGLEADVVVGAHGLELALGKDKRPVVVTCRSELAEFLALPCPDPALTAPDLPVVLFDVPSSDAPPWFDDFVPTWKGLDSGSSRVQLGPDGLVDQAFFLLGISADNVGAAPRIVRQLQEAALRLENFAGATATRLNLQVRNSLATDRHDVVSIASALVTFGWGLEQVESGRCALFERHQEPVGTGRVTAHPVWGRLLKELRLGGRSRESEPLSSRLVPADPPTRPAGAKTLVKARSRGGVLVKVGGDFIMTHGGPMDKKQQAFGAGVHVEGSVVQADSIQDSFNVVGEPGGRTDVRDALAELGRQLRGLAETLPSSVQATVASDFTTLTREALKAEPRREWYELSAKGLLQAAECAATLGRPVVDAVQALLSLLNRS
jgi:hypothetical protein